MARPGGRSGDWGQVVGQHGGQALGQTHRVHLKGGMEVATELPWGCPLGSWWGSGQPCPGPGSRAGQEEAGAKPQDPSSLQDECPKAFVHQSTGTALLELGTQLHGRAVDSPRWCSSAHYLLITAAIRQSPICHTLAWQTQNCSCKVNNREKKNKMHDSVCHSQVDY